MKILSIILLVGVFVCCNFNEPKDKLSDDEILLMAHGMWRADSGDIDISSGPGFLRCGWFAVKTGGSFDSVDITWDDGLTCTTTKSSVDGDKIIMIAHDYVCEFNIVDASHITVHFSSNSNLYTQYLIKESDDPTVRCF